MLEVSKTAGIIIVVKQMSQLYREEKKTSIKQHWFIIPKTQLHKPI